MTELRTKILLTVAITSLLAHCWVAAQTTQRPKPAQDDHTARYHNRDSKTRTITWCVPMVIFFLIIAVGIGLVYVLYRVHSGTLCCLKPKMRYRPQENNDESSDAESGDYHELVCHTPPPTYEAACPPNEYPPDYNDALQDVIVSDSYLPYSTHAPDFEPTVLGEMASNSCEQADSIMSPASSTQESPMPTTTTPESAPDDTSACDITSNSRSHSCPPYEATNEFANRIPSSEDVSPAATMQVLPRPTPPELDTNTETSEADNPTVTTDNSTTRTQHLIGDSSPGRVSRCSFYRSEENPNSPATTTGSDLEDCVDSMLQDPESQSLIFS